MQSLDDLVMRSKAAWWRVFYELFAGYTERHGAPITCMNWGYAELAQTDEHVAGEHYMVALYERLTRGVSLEGATIGEIGCGRGGGLAHITRERRPACAVGMDYARQNIAACRRAHRSAGGTLSFVVGRADAMPLPSGGLDALLSVESSHCYPSLPRFVAEAARVVRPGGWFLWTDLAEASDIPELRSLARRSFELVGDDDITSNVLAAIERDQARRLGLIDAHAGPWLRPLLTTLAAADETSRTVRLLREGRWRYFLLQARRCA